MIRRLRELLVPRGLTPPEQSKGEDQGVPLIGHRFNVLSVVREGWNVARESILTHPLSDRPLNVDYPDPWPRLPSRAKGRDDHPHLLTDFKGNFVTVLEPG
jgi:hypothetical protein